MGIKVAKTVSITNDGIKKEYYNIVESLLMRIRWKISPIKMKHEINKAIRKGYIDKDLTPLKCPHCNSKELKRGEEWYGPLGVEEYIVLCSKCDKQVGH